MTMRCTGQERMGRCVYRLVQSKPEQIDCSTEHTVPHGRGDLWVAPVTAGVSCVLGLSAYFQVDRLRQAHNDARMKLQQQKKKWIAARSTGMGRLEQKDELVNATENAFMYKSLAFFRVGEPHDIDTQQQRRRRQEEKEGEEGSDVEGGDHDETTDLREQPSDLDQSIDAEGTPSRRQSRRNPE